MYQSMKYEEFDKDCTGKFKVYSLNTPVGPPIEPGLRNMFRLTFVIYQEVKRKKYIFFSETLYVPMTELITYSSDKAQTILEDVEKLYIPINRAKILAQVLR